MHEHLFEYAVVRVVPKVEREEFLNVGIILLCTGKNFLESRVTVDSGRVSNLCPAVDLEVVTEHINSFRLITSGGAMGGPIGLLNLRERFRWLTASRSTMIQTSKVHPGLCESPGKMLEHLYRSLVEC
ncbi:MAG: DUF3037 domain-containing protein [Chryseolinea sp.]